MLASRNYYLIFFLDKCRTINFTSKNVLFYRCELCVSEQSYPNKQNKQGSQQYEVCKSPVTSNCSRRLINSHGTESHSDSTASYYDLDALTGRYQSESVTGNSWNERPRMLPGHWGHSGKNGPPGTCGQPGKCGQDGSVRFMIVPKSVGEGRLKTLMKFGKKVGSLFSVPSLITILKYQALCS